MTRLVGELNPRTVHVFTNFCFPRLNNGSRIDAPAGSIPVNKERKGLLFEVRTPVVSRSRRSNCGNQRRSTGLIIVRGIARCPSWLLVVAPITVEHNERENQGKDNNQIIIHSLH